MNNMRIIGHFTRKIIELLELPMKEGTPIYLGESNELHMKSRHPYEYDLYYNDIELIVQQPDYVGFDSNNGSIEFVKRYIVHEDTVQVSVKVTASGKYFARTLFSMMTYKAERYVEQGHLKPVS